MFAKKQKDKNVAAVIFGFLLILLVAAFTFSKTFKNKENAATSTEHSSETDISNLPIIKQDALAQALAKSEDLEILDIRPKEEFALEHIFGSINAPLPDLPDTLNSLEKENHYIFVDENGSAQVLSTLDKFLSDSGFNDVSYLSGGFSGWKKNNNATISFGDPKSFVDQSKVTYLNSDELKEIITNSPQEIAIIDLRKVDAFNDGHIAGSLNIFLDDLEKRKKDIPLGKKIILYDNDGLWAFQGAVRLFDMGFFNVQALSDGFQTWRQKGFK